MKVRSTLSHNLGLIAQHGKAGSGVPARIQVIAGSLMEFSDAEWKAYEKAAAGAIESGGLVIVEEVAKTEEELAAIKKAELEAAKKLLEDAAKDGETKEQDDSSILGKLS